jgi:hypothetical protein
VNAKNRVITLDNKLRGSKIIPLIIQADPYLPLSHAGVQQDRLAELKKAKSTDAERAQLRKSLLGVTRQRADIAEQYAVCAHSTQ